jgi:hypothetical protein
MARNLDGAQLAAREMGGLSLLDGLDFVALTADVRPERFEPAAVRWHGRFELESVGLTLPESELALAALGALRGGGGESYEVLKKLLRRVRPTLVPPIR